MKDPSPISPEFRQGAAGVGFVNLRTLAGEEVIRTAKLAWRVKNIVHFSFPLVILGEYLKEDIRLINKKKVILGSLALPVDGDNSIPINYIGPEESFKTFLLISSPRFTLTGSKEGLC